MSSWIPKVVTFDCASTLLDVRLREDGVVLAAAAEFELPLGDEAGETYRTQLASRIDEYRAAVQAQDQIRIDNFWVTSIEHMLVTHGVNSEPAVAIYRRAREIIFAFPSAALFPYGDVVPCLMRLRRQGIRVGVVSNWDNTLDLALTATGLAPYVDFSVASLVFGHEKPDVRIFEHVIAISGVGRTEIVHVGDDEDDDFHGASSAGIRSVWLRRSLAMADLGVNEISSLDELEDTWRA